MLEAPGLSTEEIAVIHGLTDDSTRNNEITLGYHQLAKRLGEFCQTDAVTWPAWATWTSKTIGVGIRWHEVRDLARLGVERQRDQAFDAWARARAPRYVAMGAMMRTLTTFTRLAERRLADGNRDVFYEIAMATTELMDAFEAEPPDDRAIADHCAQVVSRAPADSLDPAPIELLREGLTAFARARSSADPSHRRELVLAGNICFAAYEQRRLQSVVAGALRGPIAHVLGFVRLGATGIVDAVDRLAVGLVTRHLLVVVTGDEVVRLGRPLTGPFGRPPTFDLWNAEPATPELRSAIARWAPRTPKEAAATRWTEYEQRVRFTTALFASRHTHGGLHRTPMTTAETEVVRIERHELLGDDPDGPLTLTSD